MKTKDQGILGEAKVLAKFVELGIPVSIPFGDNCSYDLVAEFNGKLNKIQVKASNQTQDGCTIFELGKRRMNTQGSYQQEYLENEVDYFALYSIQRDKIFLIDYKIAPKKSINIRFISPKNNQPSLSRMEEDYLIDTILTR